MPIPHPVWHVVRGTAIATLLSLIGISEWAEAQSITAAADGTGTTIQYNGNTYHINGGTQAGANLFHSFETFGLSPGEIANFRSHPSLVNILGRVTGGDPSVIEGLLQVSGSNANLYLMNPVGIVFGANAQLNVGGDFFATTANQICFESDCFNAVGVNDYAALSGNPTTLGFLQAQPGGLLNAGILDVHKGKSIHLSGGTVVNLGQILAPGGMATVAAVPGARRVRLNQPGDLLSLEVTDTVLTEGIEPLALPGLLTGIGRDSALLPSAGSGATTEGLPLQGDVVIEGGIAAAQVDLYATGQVVPHNAGLIQGDTRVVRFTPDGENPDQAVFIDPRADHPEQLLYGAEAGTVSQIIGREKNGIGVISEQLSAIHDSIGELASVAIVAEGNAGNFWLGNQWLRSETIAQHQHQLQTWGAALTENADILLYSCFTALGATGDALVSSLARFTGADVAASVDVTGSADYGGNWHLETATGSIEANNPFTPETLDHWQGKLNTLTVDSAMDDGSGFTLRDALNAANNDITIEGQTGSGTDTIRFDTGGVFATPQTITTTMGELSITDNLILEGTGQANLAIEGTATNRVFNSLASSVTLRNLTIQNGTPTTGAGGGIRQTGIGTLTLENVTVSGNVTTSFGGGIFANGNLFLTQSTVSGNSAGSDGGGIFSTNNITLNQSTITANQAHDAGGFYSPATVIATDSMITNNSATVQGGGGDVRTTLNLINSTISDNTAGSSGGGLFLVNTDLTLINSTISGNSATSLGGGIADISSGSININNSTIENNLSDGVGGGILTSGTLDLSNVVLISGNSATLQGGGIYIFGNTVTVSNSTIENNLAGHNGGGIYSNSEVNLTNAMISGNSAALSGGGIYSGNTVTVAGSTIAGNSAGLHGGGIHTLANATINNAAINTNSAMNNGGGIYSETGDITVTNSTITHNSANSYGGGIGAVGDILVAGSTVAHNSTGEKGGGIASIGNTTIAGSTITHNLANEDGGGITTVGNITLYAAMIANNSSGRNGGGAYSEMGNIIVTGSTILGNQTADNGGGLHGEGAIIVTRSTISDNAAIAAVGDGGGIYSNGDITLTSVTINNNVAGDEGGGIWAEQTVNVNDSTISGNSALDDDGGGINSNLGNITLNHSTVSGNSAGDDGGGIESGNGVITLNNSIVSGNSAADNGGGIASNNGNIMLNNSTVSGNSTHKDGGGIANTYGTVHLDDSHLTGNLAGEDGGGLNSVFGPVTLTDTLVSGNSATRSGGGIYSSSDVTVSDSTVSGNTALFNGGGIRGQRDVTLTHAVLVNNTVLFGNGGGVDNDSNLAVNYSTIAHNFANRNGGGIYGGGTTTILGSTISGNTASNDGGGIYGYGNITINNSTLSGNLAEDGGGIRNRGAVTATNTTFSGNSATQRGGAIHSFGGAVTLHNATIAFNTAVGTGAGGGIEIADTEINQITNTIIANNSGMGAIASDLRANLISSTVQNSLIQSTAGITGAALATGLNGNIIGQDPLLAPLANNGGNTQTHALRPGSPALNTGDNSLLPFGLSTDQAGQARIIGGTVDLGAFEGVRTVATPTPASTSTMPTAHPDLDLNPVSPLNTLDRISRETMSRDRIAALLAEGHICQAAVSLDQYHSQTLAQHLDRAPIENSLSCIEMQQRLNSDSALLYIFAQTDTLHLIALTSEDDPSHYQLPLPRETLLRELGHFRQELTDPVRRLSQSFLPAAQQLYQWMIHPVLPELEQNGINKILFGLDEGLRTLPIAALYDGEQFLIEQYQATLIPSLALTPTHRPRLADAAVLSVGISAFEQFAPLPAVPLELASIETQFPVGTNLQNEQATLANFQRQLQAQPSPIVHLATHGNFQSGQAANSYLQFWDEPLTLEQLGELDWSQAAVELLVLSACRTAFGDPTAEYGFAGLAVQAQAGAAVAGLWLVNDVATLALMDGFYRQLSRGQPKGEALRQAQLALLRGQVHLEEQQLVGVDETVALPPALQGLGDRTFWHPYYWSGFTLIGNPW
ncbi:MAG: CHAT domain-containing protein [Cyanobacteria bacterium P01_G01_bin.54]